MKTITEKKYDVVVLGGGPSGLAAAVACARRGRRVLLVERNAYLGGTAVSGLGILGYLDRKGRKSLGGFAEELMNRLMEVHGAIGNFRCPVHNSISPISPACMKIVAVEMCREAGVEVLFNHELLDAEVDNGRVTEITVFSKGVARIIPADIFIDSTGDGDLAYMAGVPYRLGQDGTGIMQPATLMFTVIDHDLNRFLDYCEQHPEDFGIKEDYAEGYNPDFFRKTQGHCFIGLTEMIKKARAAGDFDIPRNQFIYICTPYSEQLAINTSRIININASDPKQVSDGLLEGYLQVHQLMRFMNKYVPGFENARLSSISPTLGIRETRHFEACYKLKIEELRSDFVRTHAIAQSAYNIDIHSGTKDHIDLTPVDEPFGIPYECCVPKTIRGLLLNGRNIDLDTETYASARVIGPCIAVGEADGEAAALALEKKVELSEVPVEELRERLRKNGNLF